MADIKGMGMCLVPKKNGIPCGSQIEDGEPIGTIVMPHGGPVIGHRDCVDAYKTRKKLKELQEEAVVKRVDQSGPGGAVDMSKATDAIIGSTPLERSPNSASASPQASSTEANFAPLEEVVGNTIKPVSSVPFKEPVDAWATGAVPAPPKFLRAQQEEEQATPDTSWDTGQRLIGLDSPEVLPASEEAIAQMVDLIKILNHYRVDFTGRMISELLLWRRG